MQSLQWSEFDAKSLMPSRFASSVTEPMRPLTRASKRRPARLTYLSSTGSGLVALGSGSPVRRA